MDPLDEFLRFPPLARIADSAEITNEIESALAQFQAEASVLVPTLLLDKSELPPVDSKRVEDRALLSFQDRGLSTRALSSWLTR
jgi:hypothetical protein